MFLCALLSLLSTGKVRQPRNKSERATSGGRATGVQPPENDSPREDLSAPVTHDTASMHLPVEDTICHSQPDMICNG